MDIVVLSDSHGNYPAVIRSVDMVPEAAAVIHLGDFCDDVLPLEAVFSGTVFRVPGNCDLHSRLPREAVLSLEGVTVLICHGDRYSVKGGLERLEAHAARLGAEVVVYGHTHMPLISSHGGILFVNPGSLEYKQLRPTFAVVTLLQQTATARICVLPPISVL